MTAGTYTRTAAHPKNSSAITKRKRQKVNYADCSPRSFDPKMVSRTLSPRFV